ncbi:MAG: hypothetical protein Pg6C_03740 [Treponemataceae bacterium]|nr:MAG: hypothetical protein Pg6C_03740 [Treponemataceae bacterium]
MSDTAVLIEEIRSLPPDLAAEALDFVGYLKQKCRKDAPAAGKAAALPPEGETHTGGSRDTPEYLRRKAMEAQSIEYINRHAEELNQEAEDVLAYQGDIFKFGSPFTEDDFVLPFTEERK